MPGYRVSPCGCSIGRRLHFTVYRAGRPVASSFRSIPDAMRLVAKLEAYRLAGSTWTIAEQGPVLLLKRRGFDEQPVRLRSWAQVALWLKGWHERTERVAA